MKYYKNLLITILSIFIIAISNTQHYCAEKKEGIENFPESYKPYLLELQKKTSKLAFYSVIYKFRLEICN